MTSAPTRPLDTTAELIEIASATGSKRSQLIGDFLIRRERLVRQIAHNLCRSNNLDAGTHLDDVMSEVHIVAVKLFEDMGSNARKWNNFEGTLTVWARNQIHSRMSSAEWTGISGNDTSNRRHRLVYATQKHLLEETGVLYEGQELVDKHNERMLATRKDAARQSVLATVGDLHAVEVRDLGDTDQNLPQFSVTDESDCPLIPHEANEVIRRTVERCYTRSERLGRVAELYLGAGGREPVTGKVEIGNLLGAHRDLIRRAIYAVQEEGRKVLAEDFGIEGI